MIPLTVSAGEMLRDELHARGWTQGQFARMVGRPDQWVSEIVNGKKAITARSAAQIGAALGTSAEMWLNMQAAHDVERLAADRALRRELAAIRRRARRITGSTTPGRTS